MNKIIKYATMLVITVVVLIALMISLARFFMPSLEQYEQQITALIAKELQLDVQFGTFAGDWYRFGPAVKVTDIVLLSPTGEVVSEIDALYISLNLLSSITERKLVPAYLNVIGLKLDLEQRPDNTLTIPSLPVSATTSTNDRHLIFNTLNKYSRISVRRSQINFKDAKGNETPIYLRSMELDRVGKNHQLNMMLNFMNHPTRLEIQAKISGQLENPKDLTIHSYVELDNAVVGDHLKSYTIEGYAAHDGNIDLRAWVDWDKGQFQRFQADVKAQDLIVYSKRNDVALAPLNLESGFSWERTGEKAWTLLGNEVRLGVEHADPIPLIENFKFTKTPDQYTFAAKTLILDHVSRSLIWSGELPEQHHVLLEDLALHGEVHNLKINWHNPQDWQLGLAFNGLTYQSFDQAIPTVQNLSGELIASPSSGKVSLNSQNSQIDYMNVFPQALLFNSITGDVVWQQTGQTWQVMSENLTLNNQDLTLSPKFSVSGGQGIDSHVDAAAVIEKLKSERLYFYLPIGEFTTDLADWLKTSIGPGVLEKIDITAKGSVKDFPYYDQGNGVFRVHANIRNMELDFDPQWPKLTHLDGQFLLTGREIQIAVEKGQIFQTDLFGTSAHITFPKEGTSWLHVHGETIADAQHVMDFIRVTPLQETVGKNLELFTFNLPMTSTLDLSVPLDNENEHTKVNGLVQVSEGDVTINDPKLQFTHVQGVFGFTERGVHSEGIHAQLFNKPVLMTMTPQISGTHHMTHWMLTGAASTTELSSTFPNPIWDYVKGESEFAVSFELDHDATEDGFDLAIASTLRGTEINLPEPFAKAKDASIPFRYTTSIGKTNNMMRVQYAKILDGVAQFTSGETPVMRGAKIRLGSELDNLKVSEGIYVTGRLPNFSYDVWENFIDSQPTANTNNDQPSAVNNVLKQVKQVDVTFDRLTAFDYPFIAAKVHLTQAQNQWLIDLNSKEWKGHINVPQANAKSLLQLHFDFCLWDSQHMETFENANPLNPRDIPALAFSCKDFSYNGKKLGHIKFNLEPEQQGLKLHQVAMTSANDSITADGRWWIAQNKEQTEFTGHLKSKSLDKTMALVGMKSTILESKTDVDFSLSWPGNPFDFALAHLNGRLDIHLDKGVLIDVNPGFGRVLSLLSIQSLQRRLRLDFSDVFKKGFSFDEITALVTINNGVANANNLIMKAPAAEMKMQGDVNLATKKLDLTAVVIAHISSSLPIAATIASGGNPIVGAVGVGVWAFDKIVKSAGGDMMGSTYHVTGTWEKPIVKSK